MSKNHGSPPLSRYCSIAADSIFSIWATRLTSVMSPVSRSPLYVSNPDRATRSASPVQSINALPSIYRDAILIHGIYAAHGASNDFCSSHQRVIQDFHSGSCDHFIQYSFPCFNIKRELIMTPESIQPGILIRLCQYLQVRLRHRPFLYSSSSRQKYRLLQGAALEDRGNAHPFPTFFEME